MWSARCIIFDVMAHFINSFKPRLDNFWGNSGHCMILHTIRELSHLLPEGFLCEVMYGYAISRLLACFRWSSLTSVGFSKWKLPLGFTSCFVYFCLSCGISSYANHRLPSVGNFFSWTSANWRFLSFVNSTPCGRSVQRKVIRCEIWWWSDSLAGRCTYR